MNVKSLFEFKFSAQAREEGLASPNLSAPICQRKRVICLTKSFKM